MKVYDRRRQRLSEGVCPACDQPLARGRQEGICNCCGFSWRLRDSEVQVFMNGVWNGERSGEGPRGCYDGATITLGSGEVVSGARVHTFHLATDPVTVTASSSDGADG